MAESIKSNVAELNNDMSKQMAILRDDIANLTAAVAEYGKAQATILRTAATDQASGIADAGKVAARAVRAKAESTYSDAEEAVRANPAAAVGVAAGVGFLVGLLATRR